MRESKKYTNLHRVIFLVLLQCNACKYKHSRDNGMKLSIILLAFNFKAKLERLNLFTWRIHCIELVWCIMHVILDQSVPYSFSGIPHHD